jgi:predicted HicB family RNase H-like nuclease
MGRDVSNTLRTDQVPWDLTEHLKDDRMCDAFLSIAESRYPDLLATVRNHIARAMSGWMMLDGYRAEVRWSDEDGCFVGRLRGIREEVVHFCGDSPSEMQEAFAKAVHEFVSGATSQRASESTEVNSEAAAAQPDENVVKIMPRKGGRSRKHK